MNRLEEEEEEEEEEVSAEIRNYFDRIQRKRI